MGHARERPRLSLAGGGCPPDGLTWPHPSEAPRGGSRGPAAAGPSWRRGRGHRSHSAATETLVGGGDGTPPGRRRRRRRRRPAALDPSGTGSQDLRATRGAPPPSPHPSRLSPAGWHDTCAREPTARHLVLRRGPHASPPPTAVLPLAGPGACPRGRASAPPRTRRPAPRQVAAHPRAGGAPPSSEGTTRAARAEILWEVWGMRGTPRIFAGDPAGLSSGQPAPVVAGDSFVAAVEFAAPPRARVQMPHGNARQRDAARLAARRRPARAPGAPAPGDAPGVADARGGAGLTRGCDAAPRPAGAPLERRREGRTEGAVTEAP